MSLEPEVTTRRALREQESRQRAAHRAPISSSRHSAAPVIAPLPVVATHAGAPVDTPVAIAVVMHGAPVPPAAQPVSSAVPPVPPAAVLPNTAPRRHSAHRHPNGARRPPLKTAVTTHVAPAATINRPVRRRVAFTSVASSIGLAVSLVIAGPAQASPLQQHSSASVVTPIGTQTMHVSGSATGTRVIMDDYSANKIVGIVAAAATGGHDAANAVALALNAGGERATIVRTALDYFGDPYVLGGASHSGIDCSGLTMVAYAAVGITLAHYVPTQDALGVTITEAEAQPGDFVVFDNEEHIGIYLGNGMVLHAPATGRTVSIEAVSIWQSVGIHFTRILPN